MSDRDGLGAWQWPITLFRWGWGALVLCLEAVVSRRGLAMIFVALGTLWTFSAWIRPPLSQDLRAVHIPCTFALGGSPSAKDLVVGARHVTWDSLGLLLAVYLGVAAVVLLWRPQYLRTIAGGLLVFTVAANTAIAWNHPALFEILVAENIQRHELSTVLPNLKQDCTTDPDNGRIPYDVRSQIEPAGLLVPWPYLFYGVWMTALAAAGILYGGRQSLWRRMKALAAWSALAVTVALLVCSPRLLGEFWWNRATLSESEAHFPEARRYLEKTVAVFPELAHVERTWLFKGALDFRQGVESQERQYWMASQLGLQKQFVLANATMEELLRVDGHEQVVRKQTAALQMVTGIRFFSHGEYGSAASAFAKAASADSARFDCVLYLGVIQAQSERYRPEWIEALFDPIVTRCADRAIVADVISMVGDAYYEAGQVTVAHQKYADSFHLYNLPEKINIPAQKALGGL